MNDTRDFFRDSGGTLVVADSGRSVSRSNEQQVAALGSPKLFGGETYDPTLDKVRLKAQLVRVRELMRDGKWRSLSEIAATTGDPEASVSARLRNLRQPKHGLWTVDRRRRSQSLWEYRLGGKGL
jgi:hypothetical protein